MSYFHPREKQKNEMCSQSYMSVFCTGFKMNLSKLNLDSAFPCQGNIEEMKTNNE